MFDLLTVMLNKRCYSSEVAEFDMSSFQ